LAVSVHVDELPTLYQKLKSISEEEIVDRIAYYQQVKKYLSLEGAVKRIDSFLRGEWGLFELIENRQRNNKNLLYFSIEDAGFGAMISRVMTGVGIALHFDKKAVFRLNGCKYIFPFEGIPQHDISEFPPFEFKDQKGNFEWHFMPYWQGDATVRKDFQYPKCPFVPVSNDKWCATILKYVLRKPIPALVSLIERVKEKLKWNEYPKKVGIRIHRGDKVSESPNLPEDVYLDYFKKLNDENIAIFLTSDDPDMYNKVIQKINVPVLWDFDEKRYNNDNKITAGTSEELSIEESLTCAKNILLLGDCDYVIGTHNSQFTWLGGLLSQYNFGFEKENHLMIDARTRKLSHWANDY
jgi:hypothetical protein